MTTTVTIIAAILYSFEIQSKIKIHIKEAGKHLDETVSICFEVFGGRFIKNSTTRRTLLNLRTAYPSHLLTVPIKAGDWKTSLARRRVIIQARMCVIIGSSTIIRESRKR